MSSWSESTRIRSKLASATVYGACDQGLAAELVVHGEALVEIFVAALRPGARELDDRQRHHRTEAEPAVRRGLHVGEEIVLAAARRAAAEHLGDGELDAVANELGAD